MKVLQALFITMYTIRCATVRNSSRKSTLRNKTACKDVSHFWKSTHRSSKTWTYKSSYKCNRCDSTKTSYARLTMEAILCTVLDANLTHPGASQPSVEALQWMAHITMVFLQTSSSLVTQLVRPTYEARSNPTRTSKWCTIESSVQRVQQESKTDRQTWWIRTHYLKTKLQQPLMVLWFTTLQSTSKSAIVTLLETSSASRWAKYTSKASYQLLNLKLRSLSKTMPSLCVRMTST